MKLMCEDKWFWVLNFKLSKTSQKLHFGVTKKDPGLVCHFHVCNLFKCLSNLGLTKFEMSIKNKIKIKNIGKQVHIFLLCHILTTQIDLAVLDMHYWKTVISHLLLLCRLLADGKDPLCHQLPETRRQREG